MVQPLYFLPSAYAEKPCWNDGALSTIIAGALSLLDLVPGFFTGHWTSSAADPVNLATGCYHSELLDFSIPSRGLNLEFKRHYNHQDSYDGPFGIGWNHSYNIFLIEASDENGNYVIRRSPEGSKDKFIDQGGGAYLAPSGVFDTLTKNAQGYLITTKYGIRYQFNASGYLSSISDRSNNQITLAYDPTSGVLTTLTDSLGRQVTLEYNSARKISRIRDFIGRTWSYGYSDGNLVTVTSPATASLPQGATVTYAYLNHNIVSVTDARGNTYLTIRYNKQNKVESMINGIGTYNFSYAVNLTTLYETNGRIDYILNDDGSTNAKKEYTGLGELETKYEYNSDKLVTKTTYPRGNSLVYSYDAKGNLLSLTRKPVSGSSEAQIATSFTYEPRFNFIKTVTGPRSDLTTYYYDYEEAALGDLNSDGVTDQAKGDLVKIAYPVVSGQTPEVKFTYNTYGQIDLTADPNSNRTKYEYYDDTGYTKKITNSYSVLNLATEMAYDAVGNVRSIKDPNANITNFEYDSHNNVIKTISAAPFSYETRYKYDANDNLIQVDKQTLDVDNPWQSAYYTYDVLDKLESIKDELNNITHFRYDNSGNRILVQDAELNSINYDYDERNLLKSAADAEGNITRYTYDENANLKTIQDARGNTASYTYDSFDRLIKTTYPDHSVEEYGYDLASNLVSKKDPKAQIISYDYDALNRLKLKAYPDAKEINYDYDLGSRLTSVADTNGTINYTYDTVNRLTQVVYPGNKTVSYEYDPSGNRTKLVYPDASYITYSYDQLNRLTYIRDQSAQAIARYYYDPLSRRTQTDLANNTSTTYEYDAIGRLLSLRGSAFGATEAISYTYDKIGNRKSMLTGAGTHSYSYDSIYQLVSHQDAASQNHQFNYDSVGNRTSVVNTDTVNYSANSLNQYTQVGTKAYTYDLNGNLTSDGANTFTYDYENRLTTSLRGASPQAGDEAIYTYDSFGRRTLSSLRSAGGDEAISFLYDGNQIIAEYDASGTLLRKYIYPSTSLRISGPGIDEPICMHVIASEPSSPPASEAIYYYHFDGLGSVTNLTNSSGAIVESYSYDAFGKPGGVSSIGNRFMFTGREYDAETGLYYYRARYYDPEIGRFLQKDPLQLDDENAYAYCSNDPVNYIDPYGYQGFMPFTAVEGMAGGIYGGRGGGVLRLPSPGDNAIPNPKLVKSPRAQQESLSESVTYLAAGEKDASKDKQNSQDNQNNSDFMQKINDIIEKIMKFLGKGAKLIKNKFGDLILISKDGLRRIRFDINNPHGDKVHMHIETKIDGQWGDATSQHRIYSK